MLTIETPTRSPEPPDTEALFREARRRRHRRWTGGVVLLVVVLAATVAGIRSEGPAPRVPNARSGLPPWSAPAGSKSSPPGHYVAADNEGGIGVYATATGKLVHELAAQTSGGPDQQPIVSGTGKSVFFVQPDGPCASSLQEVSLDGSSRQVLAISAPGMLALDPAPSPTSTLLAWVGSVCGPGGPQFNVFVTNRATGQRSDLGPYTGSSNDDGLAWSRDGKLLAVEATPTVNVLEAEDALSSGSALVVRSGCALSNPAFVSHHQLAVIRTCFSTPRSRGSSEVVMYSTKTGRPTALVAIAPHDDGYRSLSIDSVGHILVGVSRGEAPALTALLRDGHLVAISDRSPLGAQWVTTGRS